VDAVHQNVPATEKRRTRPGSRGLPAFFEPTATGRACAFKSLILESTMKTLTAVLASLLLGATVVAGAQSPPPASDDVHRYLVERTFTVGALDGLDAPLKAKVNANNALFGVHWVMSYANSAKTKTYCIYEGPSEAAIRKAATANGLPIDSITEVPVTLLPK
jgi:hypothetical protein